MVIDNSIYNTKNGRSLHAWFITGYSDGDSSFSIRLRSNLSGKLGFRVSIVYSIGAEINPENRKLLEQVKKYFGGVGSISKCANMYVYEIASIKAPLRGIVRKHFEEFPLQTSKFVHFQLWCQVMDMIEKGEHLTMEGFLKILAIKAVVLRTKRIIR